MTIRLPSQTELASAVPQQGAHSNSPKLTEDNNPKEVPPPSLSPESEDYDRVGTPDSERSDPEAEHLHGEQHWGPNERPYQPRRTFTQQDADSLVGGELVSLRKEHSSKPDPGTQKVFLFSLPFGGLSLIRAGFKLPFSNRDSDPEVEALRLKLERLQLITTVDEAKVFSEVKHTDDVRFRAMKHLIKENVVDFLPEFIVRKERPYEAVYSELDGPIVVMGGYRGLILREKMTGRRAWVPLKAGFKLRNVNLLLGPTRDDELRATDLIYSDGVLKNIGPFDICKRFIKKLDNGRTTVKEFGYDWRLSLDLLAAELIKTLESLKKKTGRTSIVVAHSMGGLVAHGALQLRPDLFRGLLYVGVPSECLNILGPIRYGDLVMFSDLILTYETNFMMRSLYAFLPLSGRVFANERTGEWYDLDYFDPETWVEYNLNPLVSSTRRRHEEESKLPHTETDVLSPPSSLEASGLSLLPPLSPMGSLTLISSRIKLPQISITRKTRRITNLQMQKRSKGGMVSPHVVEDDSDKLAISFSEAYAYLADTLKRTKEWLLGLEYREELASKYPPLAVVYGDKVPSVRGSYVNSRQDIRDGSYYHFFYGRGDGVVHQKWLLPENKGFKMHDPKTGEGHIVGKFASSFGHVNLMGDIEAMADGLHAIVEADKKWRRS